MRAVAALAALALALPAAARGDRAQVELQLRALPVPAAPPSLAMRAAPAPVPPPVRAAPRTDGVGKRLQQALAQSLLDVGDTFEDLDERVVFHANLGFGVDGGQVLGDPPRLASGAQLLTEGPGSFYEPTRIYGFGDAVIGSRGLLLPSMTTYFAAQWRVQQGGRPLASGVPTVYDASGSGSAVLVRSGWGEIHDLFRHPLLEPVFVRAGRQFRLGPAIAHFDGVTVGYDTPGVSLGAFTGQRVALYGVSAEAGDNIISGGNARVRLSRLFGRPVTLTAEALTFDDVGHAQGGVAVQLARRAQLRALVRTHDGALAREHVSLRARLSKVTTLQLSVDNRHTADWTYDLVVAEPTYGGEDPRRFLSFGVPRPRARLSLRAGTVLFDNLDLLVRAAAAVEHGGEDEPGNSLYADYLEGGFAIEGRIRRSLRLGTSALVRRYDREPQLDMTLGDGPGTLPLSTGALGERSFVESDLSLQYVRGAKQFSARAEGYMRVYSEPERPALAYDGVDARPGARFSVEGWAGDHLRLKGEYETAFVPEHVAPEIRGAKSLRVFVEGSF